MSGFGDQPRQIGFGEAKLTRPRLTVGNQLSPAPVFEITLDGLAHQLGRRSVFLVGGGLHLGGKLRWQAKPVRDVASSHWRPFIPLAWAVSSKWRGARKSQCGLPRSDDDAVVAHESRGAARSAAALVLSQPICGAAARDRLARHEALFVADRGAGGEECDRSGRTRRRDRKSVV